MLMDTLLHSCSEEESYASCKTYMVRTSLVQGLPVALALPASQIWGHHVVSLRTEHEGEVRNNVSLEHSGSIQLRE
jgi:hypothetical protein